MKERKFDKFFEKIKFITKKNTSTDIAKLLGIASSTFSEKKYKDQIPYEQVVKFCENILPQKNQTTFSKSLFLKE